MHIYLFRRVSIYICNCIYIWYVYDSDLASASALSLFFLCKWLWQAGLVWKGKDVIQHRFLSDGQKDCEILEKAIPFSPQSTFKKCTVEAIGEQFDGTFHVGKVEPDVSSTCPMNLLAGWCGVGLWTCIFHSHCCTHETSQPDSWNSNTESRWISAKVF